jgi:hypothetical protein
MKKTVYLLGLASGVIVAQYWRVLFKESVKAGVRAGRVIRRVSTQAMEEMEDANAEALNELAEQDTKAGQ